MKNYIIFILVSSIGLFSCQNTSQNNEQNETIDLLDQKIEKLKENNEKFHKSTLNEKYITYEELINTEYDPDNSIIYSEVWVFYQLIKALEEKNQKKFDARFDDFIKVLDIKIIMNSSIKLQFFEKGEIKNKYNYFYDKFYNHQYKIEELSEIELKFAILDLLIFENELLIFQNETYAQFPLMINKVSTHVSSNKNKIKVGEDLELNIFVTVSDSVTLNKLTYQEFNESGEIINSNEAFGTLKIKAEKPGKKVLKGKLIQESKRGESIELDWEYEYEVYK